MQEHRRYEELCAQVGVGQISTEELNELHAHMENCNSCKDMQSEFVEINSLWLTQAQQHEPEMYDPQTVLRRNILRKLESAGAQFSAPLRKEIAERPEKVRRIRFGSFQSPVPVWAVAAMVVASFIGFEGGSLRHSSSAHDQIPVGAAPTASVVIAAPEKNVLNPPADNAELLAAQRAEAGLRQKLAVSEAERVRLQNQMRIVTEQIAALQAARNQDASELAQLKATADQDHASAVAANVELRTLQEAQDSKDAQLIDAHLRLQDLQSKLSLQAAAAERDRELAALASSSEMEDVIGSPNLHVVDVADVDNNGVRKPFGRVFYTQGKSLIFYAYNLANTKGKQTFYAWGQKEGDPNATRVLGALVRDDRAQGRWVFRYNDTKVLARIDSVSITLEPNRPTDNKPRGERLLLAYLGTPANHP